MDQVSLSNAALKLAVSILLGGAVGWQREARDHPAGLRTHILVCVGACLAMITSFGVAAPIGATGVRSDPGRIAAQVISGIGFLGAGTILRQGSVVRGLTTAASLWTVAGIGLAAGLGGDYIWIAAIATLMVLATLALFGRVELLLITRRQLRDLHVVLPRNQVGELVRFLADRAVGIRSMESSPPNEEGFQRLRLTLRLPPRVDTEHLTHALIAISGIREIDWE